ncbi:hypothetical protein [Kitasatospora cineracea]
MRRRTVPPLVATHRLDFFTPECVPVAALPYPVELDLSRIVPR